jgi:hypothetical protein
VEVPSGVHPKLLNATGCERRFSTLRYAWRCVLGHFLILFSASKYGLLTVRHDWRKILWLGRQ